MVRQTKEKVPRKRKQAKPPPAPGAVPQTVTDSLLVAQAAARLEKGDLRTFNANTAVPRPKLTLLQPRPNPNNVKKNVWKKRQTRRINHDVLLWKKHAPVYCLRGVRLQSLQARHKNADKLQAQMQIEDMVHWESDGTSGVFQDEEGNPLVAYFARRRVNDPPITRDPIFYEPGPNTPSAMGRSPTCLDQAELDGEAIYFDGIGTTILNKTLVATQLLVHHIGVHKNNRDGRHDQGDLLCRYALDGGPPCGIVTEADGKSFVLEGIEYVYRDRTFSSEKTGVVHLVHAWPEQGRNPKIHGIHPSADMVAGCRNIQYVQRYFHDTEELAMLLAAMFRESFPAFYWKYRRAFQAGKWTVVDPGPFLGRAIVWKLDVCPHQDGLDEGPAVIFPMGDFSGGECYLPDLKLKLTYRPGEVIIMMSGALYHAIGQWAPGQGISDEGITPGRIGNVFFFPHASYEFLKDKPEGWCTQTVGGQVR